MISIVSLKNRYAIYDGEKLEHRDAEEMADYYADIFANSRKHGVVIWQSGLSSVVYDILRILHTIGYYDVSATQPPVKAMRSGEYCYLLSSQGIAYKIIVKCGKKTVYVYNSDNLLTNLSAREIIGAWGRDGDGDALDTLARASMRGIVSLGGGQEKKTPFTLSMRAAREWNRIEGNFWDPNMCDAFSYSLPTGESLDAFCRAAYHGGWNYRKDDVSHETLKKGGRVYDVNSLYPFIMMNYNIPWGNPTYFVGDIPDDAKGKYKYFFVRIKLKAKLKQGKHFPFLRKRGDLRYSAKEYISTTNIIDRSGKEIEYIGKGKNRRPVLLETTLTKTEYEMLYRHYDVEYIEIIDGVWFKTTRYGFKKFISTYYEQKRDAKRRGDKGTARVAKMMMNSLSGTLAKMHERTSLLVQWNDENDGENDDEYTIDTRTTFTNSKSYVYMAAAILAYAREYTIESAIDNYDSFLYSDTDSLHLIGKRCKNLLLDDGEDRLGAWKIEHEFDEIYYYKNKVYAMRCGDKIELKFAGMSKNYRAVVERLMELLYKNEFPFDTDYTEILDEAHRRGMIAGNFFDVETMETPWGTATQTVPSYYWREFIEAMRTSSDIISCLDEITYPTGVETVRNFTTTIITQWVKLQ